MSSRVGPLSSSQYSRWMSSHAHQLKERIPLPECRWAWAETELSRSELHHLRDAGLIRQTGDQQWQTTDLCIEAIEAYGRIDADDIGVRVRCGMCAKCAQLRRRERKENPCIDVPQPDETEQKKLTQWGMEA